MQHEDVNHATMHYIACSATALLHINNPLFMLVRKGYTVPVDNVDVRCAIMPQAGGQAVGVTGKDGNLLNARQMTELDIGFVGEVTKVLTSQSFCSFRF